VEEINPRVQSKAMCVVQSWLSSWGIPFESQDGCLIVDNLKVATSPTPSADFVVDTDTLLGRDHVASMEEMQRLMASLGRLTPEAPRAPGLRRAAADDYLARSMRLNAFARTANPPTELLEKYKPIVKREADRAYRRYPDLVHKLLLEPQDLLNIGMVFLTIYLHRYQDANHDSRRNGANLTLYLHQEFSRWASVTHKDVPSIVIDPRGILAEQIIQAPVPGAAVEWWGTWSSDAETGDQREPSYTMPEYIPYDPTARQEGNLPHHLLYDLLTDEEFAKHVKRCPACKREGMVAREQKAHRAEVLAAQYDVLMSMPHDQFVETLAGVMDNTYVDGEARHLATALFKEHMRKCEPCRAAWRAWGEVSRPTSRASGRRTQRAQQS
jgi:hypothetical protein